MNINIRSLHIIGTLLIFLLTACGASTPEVESQTSVPVASITGYQPVSAEVCQILMEEASAALGLSFTMEASAPFTDYASAETGLGCTLTVHTNGTVLENQNDPMNKLVAAFIGWTEDMKYAADGPTGTARGLTRDAGLMLISVNWEPSADSNCPSDQPIGACELTPEQKLYTIVIQAAQK